MPLGNITSKYLGMGVDQSAGTGLSSKDQRTRPADRASYVDDFAALAAVGGLGVGGYFAYNYLKKDDRIRDLASITNGRHAIKNDAAGQVLAKNFVGFDHFDANPAANYKSNVNEKMYSKNVSSNEFFFQGQVNSGSVSERITEKHLASDAFAKTEDGTNLTEIFEKYSRITAPERKGPLEANVIKGAQGEGAGVKMKVGQQDVFFPFGDIESKNKTVADKLKNTPLFKQSFGNEKDPFKKATKKVFGGHASYTPTFINPLEKKEQGFYEFFNSMMGRLDKMSQPEIEAVGNAVFKGNDFNAVLLRSNLAKALTVEMSEHVEYGGLEATQRGIYKQTESFNPLLSPVNTKKLNPIAAIIGQGLKGGDRDDLVKNGMVGINANPGSGAEKTLGQQMDAIRATRDIFGVKKISPGVVTPAKAAKGYTARLGLDMEAILPMGSLKEMNRPTHEQLSSDIMVATHQDVQLSRYEAKKGARKFLYAGHSMETAVTAVQRLEYGAEVSRGDQAMSVLEDLDVVKSSKGQSLPSVHGLVAHVRSTDAKSKEVMTKLGLLAVTGKQEGTAIFDQEITGFLTKQVQAKAIIYKESGIVQEPLMDSLVKGLTAKYGKPAEDLSKMDPSQFVEALMEGRLNKHFGAKDTDDLLKGVRIDIANDSYSPNVKGRVGSFDISHVTNSEKGIKVAGWEVKEMTQGSPAIIGEAHFSIRQMRGEDIGEVINKISGKSLPAGLSPVAVTAGGMRDYDYFTGKFGLADRFTDVAEESGASLSKEAKEVYKENIDKIFRRHYEFARGDEFGTEGRIITDIKDSVRNVKTGDTPDEMIKSLADIRLQQEALLGKQVAGNQNLVDLMEATGGVIYDKASKSYKKLDVGGAELFINDVFQRTTAIHSYQGGKQFAYTSSGGKIRVERAAQMAQAWSRYLGKDADKILSPITGRMTSLIRGAGVEEIGGVQSNVFDEADKILRLNYSDAITTGAKKRILEDTKDAPIYISKSSGNLQKYREIVSNLNKLDLDKIDFTKAESLPEELREFMQKGVYVDSDVFEKNAPGVLDRSIGASDRTIGEKGGMYFAKYGVGDRLASADSEAYTGALSRRRLKEIGRTLDLASGEGSVENFATKYAAFTSYETSSLLSKGGILNNVTTQRAYGLSSYSPMQESGALEGLLKGNVNYKNLVTGKKEAYDFANNPLERIVTEKYMMNKHGMNYTDLLKTGATESGAYDVVQMSHADFATNVVDNRSASFTDEAVLRYFDRSMDPEDLMPRANFLGRVASYDPDLAALVDGSAPPTVEQNRVSMFSTDTGYKSSQLQEQDISTIRKVMKAEAKSDLMARLESTGVGSSGSYMRGQADEGFVEIGIRSYGMESYEPWISSQSDYAVSRTILRDPVSHLYGMGIGEEERQMWGFSQWDDIFGARYGEDASHVVHTAAISRYPQFRDLDFDTNSFLDMNFADPKNVERYMNIGVGSSETQAGIHRTSMKLLQKKQLERLSKTQEKLRNAKLVMSEAAAKNFGEALVSDDLAQMEVQAAKTAQKVLTGPNTVKVNTHRQMLLGISREKFNEIATRHDLGAYKFTENAAEIMYTAQAQVPIQKGAGAYSLMQTNQEAVKFIEGALDNNEVSRGSAMLDNIVKLTLSGQGSGEAFDDYREKAANDLAKLVMTDDHVKQMDIYENGVSTLDKLSPEDFAAKKQVRIQEQSKFLQKTFSKITKHDLIPTTQAWGETTEKGLDQLSGMISDLMREGGQKYQEIKQTTGVSPERISGIVNYMGQAGSGDEVLADIAKSIEADIPNRNIYEALLKGDNIDAPWDLSTSNPMSRASQDTISGYNEKGNVFKVGANKGASESYDNIVDKTYKEGASVVDDLVDITRGLYDMGGGKETASGHATTRKALESMKSRLTDMSETGSGKVIKYGAGIMGGLWVASHAMNYFDQEPAWGDPDAPSTGSAPLPHSTVLDSPVPESGGEGYTPQDMAAARISFEGGQTLGADINVVHSGNDIDSAFAAVPNDLNYDNAIIQDSRKTFDRFDAERFSKRVNESRF